MRDATRTFFHGLALAFLAGEWTPAALRARARQAVDDSPLWLPRLVKRVLRAFPSAPGDDGQALVSFLEQDRRLRRLLCDRSGHGTRIREWFLAEATVPKVDGPPAQFAVEPLATLGDVARALGLSPAELSWFADTRGINGHCHDGALSHYRFRWAEKRTGGYRLFEAPKPRLKAIQRQILRTILDKVPASPVAHGFVTGRSVRTFAEPHVGAHLVVRMDLSDFFNSIGRARVVALFRRLGYSRTVALTLAGLCTVAAPSRVLSAQPRQHDDLDRRFVLNQRLRDPHLPQGAPTSPALANLAVFRLDARLTGLATRFGARMTRYADDLAFSGGKDFDKALPHFLTRVGGIALEEGFTINFRKTRVMRRSERQHVCGVVVNETPNLARRDYDALKATLWNCVRSGPASQNRDGHADFRCHLEGRIAWFSSIHKNRGDKLRALFERIVWPTPASPA
jgi:hypothetical protein